jgi:RimJ/RimL family protein N-acetyltransferase
MRIERLTPKYFRSVWEALDVVARERKYLIFQQAPPLDESVVFYNGMMGEKGIMLIGLDGERVVGWCDVRRNDHEISKHCGTLGMGLLPDYRGRGLGTQLITQTLEAIRSSDLGISRVELTVWGSNVRAAGLYEKVGFAYEGRKVGARKVDGVTDDVLLMAKFIN